MSAYCFISYSHEDRDQVRPVVDAIRATGLGVEWDESFDASSSIKGQVEARIENAFAVIVFAGKSTSYSGYVNTEINLAEKAGVPVYAVVLPGGEITDLPAPLQGHAAIKEPDLDATIGRLLEQLRARPAFDGVLARLEATMGRLESTMRTQRSGGAVYGASFALVAAVLAIAMLLWQSTQNPAAASGGENGSTDTIQAFVENVDFKLPTIPDGYKKKSMLTADADRLLRRFGERDVELALTPEEIARLNAIANRSGMIHTMDEGSSHSLSDVRDLCRGIVLYHFDYKEWQSKSKAWAASLPQGPETDDECHQALHDLCVTMAKHQRTAGLLQAVIGMMTNAVIEVRAADESRSRPRWVSTDSTMMPTALHFTSSGFKAFRVTLLGMESDPIRAAAAKKLAGWFLHADIPAIREALQKASVIFGREVELFDEYVVAWNEILSTRRPSRLDIEVSFSNPREIAAFLRGRTRIVIGSPGGDESQMVSLLAAIDDKADDKDTLARLFSQEEDAAVFVQVPAQSTVTRRFSAELPAAVRDRLFAAYESGFSFLKAGFLSPTGSSEIIVTTARIPFSRSAQEQWMERVGKIEINLSDDR